MRCTHPKRIYLGGHSTGGTLTLLTAESTDRFRAVFSFGPVDDPTKYGSGTIDLPFDTSNASELQMRKPIRWLNWINTPTFIMEGTDSPSNIGPLHLMSFEPHPTNVHFLEAPNHSHFSILAPANELIARKIVQDQGVNCAISISDAEMRELAK